MSALNLTSSRHFRETSYKILVSPTAWYLTSHVVCAYLTRVILPGPRLQRGVSGQTSEFGNMLRHMIECFWRGSEKKKTNLCCMILACERRQTNPRLVNKRRSQVPMVKYRPGCYRSREVPAPWLMTQVNRRMAIFKRNRVYIQLYMLKLKGVISLETRRANIRSVPSPTFSRYREEDTSYAEDGVNSTRSDLCPPQYQKALLNFPNSDCAEDCARSCAWPQSSCREPC
jgi:hypothetical protein